MSNRIIWAIAIFVAACDGSSAADDTQEMLSAAVDVVPRSVLSGRVVALDGRTLWFPANKKLVRLSGIDSCGLVQWSFDPKATPVTAPILAPVPCGALAKAWLKRMIGGSIVYCETVAIGKFHGPEGRCSVDNRDLALEMLRVGWAKLSSPGPYVRGYVEAQQAAIAARYGMWGTYLLNMQEWREKALDKTLGRRPHSDINLLGERDSEISPPFLDARRQPMLRDR